MSVVVFGSINMDLVVRTPRLPVAGETLTGYSFSAVPGGKGANQAVACARAGVLTRMIGHVGDDVFGGTLRGSLRAYGVDIADVKTCAGQSSGVAMIEVDDAAENNIIVVPGANGTISLDDLPTLNAALVDAVVLLLQLEIPLEAVIAAAQAGRKRGVPVILDPAPAQALPPELFDAVDILTPNETEAAILAGFPVGDESAAERAARTFIERGVRRVVVKMGSKGACWNDGTAGRFEPAFRVKAVDTVAAGDAFNGALAAALSTGLDFPRAVRWGMAAGALSATKPGAQPSMPDRASILAMLGQGSA